MSRPQVVDGGEETAGRCGSYSGMHLNSHKQLARNNSVTSELSGRRTDPHDDIPVSYVYWTVLVE